MRRLRTLSPRRLSAVVAAVVLLAASAAIAQAGLIGGDPKPEPKPLDRAILDAANAPAVDGVSARISFTNGLLPSGSLPGGGASPLAAGADGRLWMARDGRFRLELQSEAGDAQIASDGRMLSVYDASAKTVYRVALPDERPEKAERGEPVTLAEVRRGLDRLARAWTLSGARPTSTAGRPSYTVRIAPKDDGGLLGAGELAWDAVKGVPLRAAVYSQDASEPVLELAATDISFGRVPDGDLWITVPAGTKTVDVDPPAGRGGAEHDGAGAAGVEAVQRELEFRLSAPRELAGLPRQEVRLVRLHGSTGALSVYGEGLGGILVLQHQAAGGEDRPAGGMAGLPQVNIDGATGTELATALGTMVTFERGGVSYTLVGSVPPAAVENAARGLR
jgi:outer membrane lipoprotein-sorting protein